MEAEAKAPSPTRALPTFSSTLQCSSPRTIPRVSLAVVGPSLQGSGQWRGRQEAPWEDLGVSRGTVDLA